MSMILKLKHKNFVLIDTDQEIQCEKYDKLNNKVLDYLNHK